MGFPLIFQTIFYSFFRMTGIPIKRQQDLVTFLKMHSHLFKVSAGMVSLIPIPVQSSHVPSPTKLMKSENQNQQSLKQRVNSVVLKVLADNSERDKTSPTPDDGAWRTNVFQRSKLVASYRYVHMSSIFTTYLELVVGIG